MTKKDFILIAETIACLPKHHENLRANRRLVASSFADSLAETNPRFNRQVFLQACLSDTEEKDLPD